MKKNKKVKDETNCDLLIIGSGMAGFSAAIFAGELGLKTVIAGKSGETLYSSGLIDLLGSFSPNEKKVSSNPWDLMEKLRKSGLKHPYTLMKDQIIEKSLENITQHLGEAGLKYKAGKENTSIITPLGHPKTTYYYPQTMDNNQLAYKNKPSCMIVGFERLRGFSPQMMKEVLGKEWKNLGSGLIKLPFFDHMSSIYTESIARFLEVEKNRDLFADLLKPYVKGFEYVGLPPVLGIRNPSEIQKELEEKISVKLFEIPAMPPSITGTRLKEAFHKILSQMGVTFLNNYTVVKDRETGGKLTFIASRDNLEDKIVPKNVLLASGRFIGKGLLAKRSGITETVFGIPVSQPKDRTKWHSRNFFDPNPVNLAGIEIDKSFRPLDAKGKPLFKNLFAAGSILSNNDWKRMKCGSGVAIASAYAAIQNMK